MKHLNLAITVEDNEILDKTIKEAIVGQARQIAREEIDKELSSEISRIADKKLKEVRESYYWSDISKRITDAIGKRLSSELAISDSMLNKLIEAKVEEVLDKKLNNEVNLDTFIQKYLDKSLLSVINQLKN